AFDLDSVTVNGPVNAGSAGSIPDPAVPADIATHGIVFVHVIAGNLADVHASGFATAGAQFFASGVTWSGGSASDNLGLGVGVEQGSAHLENVEVCRTMQGFRLFPAAGLYATGANLETTGLHACANEGLGVLQLGGAATHAGFDASDNG